MLCHGPGVFVSIMGPSEVWSLPGGLLGVGGCCDLVLRECGVGRWWGILC